MGDSKLFFAIDSLVERDGLIFGWGWVRAPGDVVRDVWINVSADGADSRIECAVTGIRTDASRADGDAFGFVVAGKLPKGYLTGSAVLSINREAAGYASEPLPEFPEKFLESPSLFKSLKNRVGELRKALRVSGLVGLGRRICSDAGTAGSAFEGRAPANELVSGIQQQVELVIDHSMGGGANKFAEELIASRLRESVDVVILRPVLAKLCYSVEWRRGQSGHKREFSDLAEAIAYLDAGHYAKVHCNHLVSYESVSDIFEFCKHQAKGGSAIAFYVHDYFSICPSWALMDSQDAFCNIPGVDVCARCLPANPSLFVSYFREKGVEAWRNCWHDFLVLCASVVVFSESTRRLLLRAYPDLDAKILLRPHEITLPPAQMPVWRPEQRWAIGIFGHISRHKGADILVEMAEIAERRGLPMEFLVFGSLSARPRSQQLRVVGPYESKEMEGIASRHNLLVTFVPSICSETFSYVTAELMHLQLPVAVFDRGAPADRVRNYESGLVMNSLDPTAALSSLEIFCMERAAKRSNFDPAYEYKRKF